MSYFLKLATLQGYPILTKPVRYSRMVQAKGAGYALRCDQQAGGDRQGAGPGLLRQKLPHGHQDVHPILGQPGRYPRQQAVQWEDGVSRLHQDLHYRKGFQMRFRFFLTEFRGFLSWMNFVLFSPWNFVICVFFLLLPFYEKSRSFYEIFQVETKF